MGVLPKYLTNLSNSNPNAAINIKHLTPAVAASAPHYPGWSTQSAARLNNHPAFANHAHYSAVEESPSNVAGLQGESRVLPNGCPTRNNAEEKDIYFKTKVTLFLESEKKSGHLVDGLVPKGDCGPAAVIVLRVPTRSVEGKGIEMLQYVGGGYLIGLHAAGTNQHGA